MSIVGKNIAANYISKLFGFVSIYLFVPLYIKLLGIESYAIINFYAVILGLLAFADGGLTATLTRELAGVNSLLYKANLLRTLEKVYFFICISFSVVLIISSKFIALYWLKSEKISADKMAYYFRCIAIGASIQIAATLFQGGLMGLQKQVLSNKLQIAWSVCRSGLVLVPLYFKPTIDVYFLWQILINFTYLIVLRNQLWKELGNKHNAIANFALLKRVWKYAAGMMLIAFISAVNIQIDKLVTSKLFSLTNFGFYSLASTLSQMPLLIATPIVIAIFPVITQTIATGDQKNVIATFHRYSFLITLITAPITIALMLYTTDFVKVWTGNNSLAENIDVVSKVLLAGGFFLCMQLMPYYVALANGHTRTNIFLGIAAIFAVIPLLFFFIKQYSLNGAGIPWAVINFLVLIIMGIRVVNRFFPGNLFKWIFQDILKPLVVTIFSALLIYWVTKPLSMGYWVILYSALIFGMSIGINILIYGRKNLVKLIKAPK